MYFVSRFLIVSFFCAPSPFALRHRCISSFCISLLFASLLLFICLVGGFFGVVCCWFGWVVVPVASFFYFSWQCFISFCWGCSLRLCFSGLFCVFFFRPFCWFELGFLLFFLCSFGAVFRVFFLSVSVCLGFLCGVFCWFVSCVVFGVCFPLYVSVIVARLWRF